MNDENRKPKDYFNSPQILSFERTRDEKAIDEKAKLYEFPINNNFDRTSESIYNGDNKNISKIENQNVYATKDIIKNMFSFLGINDEILVSTLNDHQYTSNTEIKEISKRENEFMDDSSKLLIERLERDSREREERYHVDAREREGRYKEEMRNQDERLRREAEEREKRILDAIKSLKDDLNINIQNIKTDLKSDIESTKNDLIRDFSSAKNEAKTTKYTVIGLTISVILGVAAMVITVALTN